MRFQAAPLDRSSGGGHGSSRPGRQGGPAPRYDWNSCLFLHFSAHLFELLWSDKINCTDLILYLYCYNSEFPLYGTPCIHTLYICNFTIFSLSFQCLFS